MKPLILFAIILLFCSNYATADSVGTIGTNVTFNCTGQESCNYHGVCNRYNTGCICNDGYVTHDFPDVQCNYEQKEQLTAFLLSFFLGIFAAGQWYVGNYALAAPKLAIGLINCCVFGSSKTSDDDGKEKKTFCATLFFLVVFAWWLADVIIFGINDYTDGDGVDLQSW